MFKPNWNLLIPLACITTACGIFWGKAGAGYCFFIFGVALVLGWFFGGD